MIEIPWLESDGTLWFPDARHALRDPNGLLAVGGDLSPDRLLSAYRQGIFPWFSEGQPILWWSPDPRATLRPGDLKISRSLRKRLRNGGFNVSFDCNFEQVMRACAAPRQGQTGTWVTEDMIAAYTLLHEKGFGHSVEVWRDGNLIGGLYGLSLGGAFFGESMFSRATDASKVALAWLCAALSRWGYAFVDCQVSSPHLLRLGAIEVPRTIFLAQLRLALTLAGKPGRWAAEPSLPTHDDLWARRAYPNQADSR